MSGELTKLKIVSFSDEETAENKKEKEFELQINPEQYKKTFKIAYASNPTPGDVGSSAEFELVEPEQLVLDFTIDGTGVVNNDLGVLGGLAGAAAAMASPLIGDDTTSFVTDKITELKDVVYGFQGTIHRPPFVKVVWGEDLFTGVLVNLDITYTLFQPDGTPLRAKINATFKEQVPQPQQELRKDTSSPDLTHVRTVNEGDTIHLMTERIYEDPIHYLEVARVNNITNFRKLKTGTTLQFPPIEKTS